MSERASAPDAGGLRIAYLFQQFPLPTETFAVSDIAALIAQGHDVRVYTLRPPRRDEAARAARSGMPSGLTVHRPGWAGVRAWPGLLWRRRRQAGWLVRQILPHWRNAPRLCAEVLICLPRLLEITDQLSRAKVDVVHAFWSRHVALVLLLLQVERAPEVRTAFAGAYDLVTEDFLLDLIVPAADMLFSHAHANRPLLEHRAGVRVPIEIVHRGIPLMPIADEERDPHRVVTASALVPAKNVDAVIRCFAAARERDGRLTLSIFGEGSDRPRLERLAAALGCAPAVTFAGHVGRDALFRAMHRAAVFILLSTKASERLPNVVKEALWAGCAVISSNSDGIEELLPDPAFGTIVDPDNAQEIATALEGLMSECPDDARRRRSAARAFIADHFSSDASMRAYVRAWRACMAMSGPSPSRA